MRAIVTDDDVLGGDPRLEGTRIGVRTVYRLYEDGERPEDIAAGYDDVTVADVHNALAFAFDNPDTMADLEARDEESLNRIRERRSVDPSDVKERA